MKKLVAVVATVIAVGSAALIGSQRWAEAAGTSITGPNEPAYFQGSVTFTTSISRGSIDVTCFQSGTEVWTATGGWNGTFLLGGTSSKWVTAGGGAADCTAVWYRTIHGVKVVKGTLSFHADAFPPMPLAPIVLILMENRPSSQITATAAPYMTGLASQGTLFTHSTAITHPSLPNYMAFSSGSTQGCSTDSICVPNTLPADNLYHQLEVAGVSWASYSENMRTNCQGYDSGTKPNKYIAHHNPVVYFTDVHTACLLKNVPLSQMNPAALPAFSFITPTNAHNMHDGTVTQGDDWLSHFIPPLLAAGAEVVVTFDEGIGTNQLIYTAVVGPGIPVRVDPAPYNDYSLLAGLEARFGFPKLLAAQTATVLPL